MSSKLKTDKRFWFVIKSCGDNLDYECFNGVPQTPNIHSFVYNQCLYATEHLARKAAEKAAREMPGNRYYVAEVVGGYMMPETKMESF